MSDERRHRHARADPSWENTTYHFCSEGCARLRQQPGPLLCAALTWFALDQFVLTGLEAYLEDR